MDRTTRLLVGFLMAFVGAGCGSSRPPAVPRDLVAPMPFGAIAMEAGDSAHSVSELNDAAGYVLADRDGDGRPDYDALALSGGGSYGAFGAGVLKGWTDSGQRPEFDVVTGVSTGALMATFAFLGPAYDDVLRRVYTTIEEDDVLDPRFPLSLLRRDALVSTEPLRRLVESVVTPEVVAGVAEQHRLGRRLYVSTTYLDRDRFVIWDLGRVAASSRPDAREHYIDILMAASAVPAVFPPVYFEVQVGDSTYGEMHTDVTQDVVFLREGLVHAAADADSADVHVTALLNRKLSGMDRWTVRPRVKDIAIAMSESVVNERMRFSVARLHAMCADHGWHFRAVPIPADHEVTFPSLEFEEAAMSDLYRVGLEVGRGLGQSDGEASRR